MIKRYNGRKDWEIIRSLRILCRENEQNLRNLEEEFSRKGRAEFYTNRCLAYNKIPTRTVIQKESEDEFKKYIFKDFLKRLDQYLADKDWEKDYLTSLIVKFIRSNGGIFPDFNQMKNLEENAEKLRRRTATEEVTLKGEEMASEQILLQEILELSEEILENKYMIVPWEVIKSSIEGGYGIHIANDKINGAIMRIPYTREAKDYLVMTYMNDFPVGRFVITYKPDGNVDFYVKDLNGNKIDYDKEIIHNALSTLHQELSSQAKTLEVGFESEC